MRTHVGVLICVLALIHGCSKERQRAKAGAALEISKPGIGKPGLVEAASHPPGTIVPLPIATKAGVTFTSPSETDPPITTTMFGRKARSQIAFDGTDFMVVWENELIPAGRVYGARLAVDGTLLDPVSLDITPTDAMVSTLAIAFNGTHYLFAMEQQAFLPTGSPVVARRIATDGSIVDTTPIAVGVMQGDSSSLTVASAGGDFLIGWIDEVGGADRQLLARRIDGAGTALGSGPEVLADLDDGGDPNMPKPGIAGATDRYLVAWQDKDGASLNGAYAMRVGLDGSHLDPAPIVLEEGITATTGPVAEFNGNLFLTFWLSDDDYRGTRISTGGQVLDAGLLALSAPVADSGMPHLTAIGSTFYLVRDENPAGTLTLKGARVTDGGGISDPVAGVTLIAGLKTAEVFSFGQLGVSGANDRYLVSWPSATKEEALHVLRINDQQVAMDGSPIAISRSANYQGVPALSYGDGEALMVFDDFRNGKDQDVYALRLDTLGAPIGSPILVAGGAQNQREPRVAFDGTQYLVTWLNEPAIGSDNQIQAARLSGAGVLLDMTPIDITNSDEHSGSAVASNGTGFMVFTNTDDNNNPHTIEATRVDASGKVLDVPAKVVLGQHTAHGQLRASTDGSGYMVAWVDNRNTKDEAYAAMVAADGTALQPDGFPLGDAFAMVSGSEVVDVTYGDNSYLAAWAQQTGGGFNTSIVARRYSANGTALDASAFPVASAAGIAMQPSVAYDGSNFIVAWDDDRGPSGSCCRMRCQDAAHLLARNHISDIERCLPIACTNVRTTMSSLRV